MLMNGLIVCINVLLFFRTREEVQEMRQTRDPITGFRDRIVGAGLAELSELKAIEAQVCNFCQVLSNTFSSWRNQLMNREDVFDLSFYWYKLTF